MNTATDIPPTSPDTDIAAAVTPVIELVLPVFNEEHIIEASVRALHSYMEAISARRS